MWEKIIPGSEQERIGEEERQFSAQRLQDGVRGHQVRKRNKQIEREHVSKIQAGIRGFRERKEISKTFKQIDVTTIGIPDDGEAKLHRVLPWDTIDTIVPFLRRGYFDFVEVLFGGEPVDLTSTFEDHDIEDDAQLTVVYEDNTDKYEREYEE